MSALGRRVSVSSPTGRRLHQNRAAAVGWERGITGDRNGPDFRIRTATRLHDPKPEQESGREVFKLVEGADVVVENYRPEVKYRLGIDYETLKAINPRIVLGSISGFGDGPEKRPGVDQIAQGLRHHVDHWFAGAGRSGGRRSPICPGFTAPSASRLPCWSAKSPGKAVVHTSLLSRRSPRWISRPHAGNRRRGAAPGWQQSPDFIRAGVYPCADGHFKAAGGQDMFERLCGRSAPMRSRPIRITPRARLQHRDALNAEISEYTKTKNSAEWIDSSTRAACPADPSTRSTRCSMTRRSRLGLAAGHVSYTRRDARSARRST